MSALCGAAGFATCGRTPDANEEKDAAGPSTGLSNLSGCSDDDKSLSQGSFGEDSDDEFVAPDCEVNDGKPPSIGSRFHPKGNCRPCSFFPHGKCRLGKNCRYCHVPHTKPFKDKGVADSEKVEHRSPKEVARLNGVHVGSYKIPL